jgi:hypothetical protein
MMVLLMTAGIGLILIGLAAIGYGIPVKEFSFGNTLIVAGAIAVGTGTILLGLRAAVAELIAALGKLRLPAAASSLEPSLPAELSWPQPRPAAPPPLAAPAADDMRPSYERAAPPPAEPIASDRETPPWQKDAERARARQRVMTTAPEPQPALPIEPAPTPAPSADAGSAAAEAAAAAADEDGRQRRNLLFHSTRRERLRARSGEGEGTDQPSLLDDLRRSAFDEAWPEPERPRGDRLRRRASESIADDKPAPAESAASAPQPAETQQPESQDKPAEVTLLKSGEVDGMTYSLYSDGSMEAQMPEGMMRFASIEELRAYLDQRS